jgi:hypothetical protein
MCVHFSQQACVSHNGTRVRYNMEDCSTQRELCHHDVLWQYTMCLGQRAMCVTQEEEDDHTMGVQVTQWDTSMVYV